MFLVKVIVHFDDILVTGAFIVLGQKLRWRQRKLRRTPRRRLRQMHRQRNPSGSDRAGARRAVRAGNGTGGTGAVVLIEPLCCWFSPTCVLTGSLH